MDQAAASSLTFKAEEKPSDLPGAPAFLRSTTSSQHWLRHPHAWEESTWTSRKCLLSPPADEGADSLDVQASALLRGRGLPYFFTVLQKWLHLRVTDTSLAKLWTNKHVSQTAQCATNEGRYTSSAPKAFTDCHDTREQVWITETNQLGKIKDIRAKNQPFRQSLSMKTGFAFTAGKVFFYLAVT